jgi:shikimate 5-dehydrogenase
MDQMPIDYEALKNLNKQAIVYDVIYNPTKTLLIEKAQACGLETINGLDMFINQAAKALEIWTGKIPDADKMKIAALESLACTN